MRTICPSLLCAIGILGLSPTTSGVIFTACMWSNTVCNGAVASQSFCELTAAPFSGRQCTSGCYEYSSCSSHDSCPVRLDTTCAAFPACPSFRNGVCDAQSLRITACRPGTLAGCSGTGVSPTPPAQRPTALPTRSEHFTQTTGTCDIPIQSIAECSRAGRRLRQGTGRGAIPDDNVLAAATSDPDGCYAEHGTLYFGSADGKNWRNSGQCSPSDVCICRSYGYNLPSNDDDDDYPIGAIVAYIVLFGVGCCITYKLWMCCIGTPKHPGLVCALCGKDACNRVAPPGLQRAPDVAGPGEVAQRNGFSDNFEI